jgi:hypothetical protein
MDLTSGLDRQQSKPARLSAEIGRRAEGTLRVKTQAGATTDRDTPGNSRAVRLSTLAQRLDRGQREMKFWSQLIAKI